MRVAVKSVTKRTEESMPRERHPPCCQDFLRVSGMMRGPIGLTLRVREDER